MGFDNTCNTGLMLGLSFSSTVESTTNPVKKAAIMSFEPSLTLALAGETPSDDDHDDRAHDAAHREKVDSIKASDGSGGNGNNLHRQDSGAATSSFSNISVKREREPAASEEVETTMATREVVNFRSSSSRVISDEDDDGVNGRKKLRLTKAQSALLEESFKSHSTLNPQKQKLELARDLKLRPRQVEVWFQNRRARTKLKQTEVDCEYLKKCCETLTDENRRLQKELQELKALKLAQPFYMQQLPAATLTMCPSCERVGGDSPAATSSKSPFNINMSTPKSHLLINPFTNPSSAAC